MSDKVGAHAHSRVKDEQMRVNEMIYLLIYFGQS